MAIEHPSRIGSDSYKNTDPVTGRKPAGESRATEFRRKLVAWNQTPESRRPSLRALARDLGTSHQLLSFFLKDLGKWQGEEYWRHARDIRDRAIAEGRSPTQWEEQQILAHNRAAVRATVGAMLLDTIERIKHESENRPLVWKEIRTLKILAPGFPEARELLQKYSQNGVKDQKSNLPPIPSDAAKSFRRVRR